MLEIGGPPGAFAAMMLGDHGADVLRVARPDDHGSTGAGGGIGISPLGRSRRSVRLNLRHPRGAEAFLRLIAEADALIEGYRPGVMERLGVGPAQCLAVNPALVYGRMTGWGQDGPWAHLAGHDVNYVALSGTLNAVGERDGPPVMPINLAGDWAGGLLMAFGVVAALHQTRATGVGVVVDTAMVDAASVLAAIPHTAAAGGTWDMRRAANMTDGGWPFYAIYRTADDRYVAVGALEPEFFAELVERMGIADQITTHQDDREGWPAMKELFTRTFAGRTLEEWCTTMEGSNACFSPVLDFMEARSHPHNVARGVFVEYEGLSQPAPAPRFDGQVSQIRPWADCAVGPEQALSDWGLGDDEVAVLLESGAVIP